MAKIMDINPFKKGEAQFKKMNLADTIAGSPIDFRFQKVIFLIKWAALPAILLFGIYWFLSYPSFPATEESKLQTIFLTDGRQYFGHLKEAGRSYISISNVYYLQAIQIKSSTSSPQQINLVKLENEIYGPENILYIPKDQIISWGNLRPDSQVVRLMRQLENEK